MTLTDAPGARPAQRIDPLLVTDLLGSADDLAALLRRALTDTAWLDAYLLAAGLCQLVEDRLHTDPLQLHRAASYLAGRPSPFARLAGHVAAGAAATLTFRRLTLTHYRLVQARHALTNLTGDLAALVLNPHHAHPDRAALGSLAEVGLAAAPLLGADVVRLPACFRSFDQHPEDMRWLVRAYLDRAPTPPTSVCVVGVRTSGSYLAPLHAASLTACGVPSVRVLTHRPDRPLLGWERRVLAATARAGGTVLVTDDPPGSGRSLASTLDAIVRAGVPKDAVTLALSLFSDSPVLPPALATWPAVLQPWSLWSVHQRLSPEQVASALSTLLGAGWRVDPPQRQPLPPAPNTRQHARARFVVRVTNLRTGRAEQRDLLVEGAGLGYLGRHAVAVADALPDQLPRVHGFADGLLYRDWLPATVDPVDEQAAAQMIADYVTTRARVLPARRDPTWRLRGRDPAWEVAAALLSQMYGRLGPAFRPWLLEPIARRLLRPIDQPSVVDGTTALGHWLPTPGDPGRLRKVDFHQRAFGHLELACYDEVFDLAGAASDPPSLTFEALLRHAYQAQTGRPVDAERWLLYRLTQLWRLAKAGDLDPARVARQSAAAVHSYLAGCYLGDLHSDAGPLCAIDLDGVLETDRLGYPAAAPAGVLALRALLAHGYRPILATGRSLDDARDRCAVFGLAGAVAEYGTVTYNHHDGTVHDLRSPAERALIEKVRNELGARALVLNPDYRYAVRARVESGPLPADLIRAIPLLGHPALQLIHGQGQSDITIRGLDKGTGLADLATRLSEQRAVLAVGDSAADLPMLAWAALARAPRNADAAVRAAAIDRTRGAYQCGLADACADLLGHHPGTCPTCRPPQFPRRTQALLAALALPENGLRGLPTRTLRLAALAAGRSQW